MRNWRARCRSISLSCDLEIWKAARVGDDFDPKSLEKYKNADRLLLDAYVEGYGGKGKRIEDERLRGIDLSGIMLAGGLNAGNIADAVEKSRPYGVDVSSGAETDGQKDAEKIKQIVNIIRSIK